MADAWTSPLRLLHARHRANTPAIECPQAPVLVSLVHVHSGVGDVNRTKIAEDGRLRAVYSKQHSQARNERHSKLQTKEWCSNERFMHPVCPFAYTRRDSLNIEAFPAR